MTRWGRSKQANGRGCTCNGEPVTAGMWVRRVGARIADEGNVMLCREEQCGSVLFFYLVCCLLCFLPISDSCVCGLC